MNHKKGISFAILTAVMWGFLAIIVKIALNEVSPITVVWVRMTIAFLGLGAYFIIKEPAAFRIITKPPKLIWLAAPGLAINYAGYAFGVEHAGPATTQVVIQLGVIILCLSGIFLFKEKSSKQQVSSFILTFVGLFFFYSRQLGSMETGRENYIMGVLFIIMGALGWATYSITQKKLVKTHPVQHINLFIFAFSTIAYAPFVDFTEFYNLTPAMWLILIFLGANTLVAYSAMGMALKYTDASKVSVVIILNPIITFVALEVLMAMDIHWFPQLKVPLGAYIGAAMMLSGAILAVGFKKKINN